MMKRRHAILLCGFARDYKEHLASFKRNNRYRDNVDLFICFWNYVNAHPKGPHAKHEDLNLIDENQIKADYSPTDIRIYDWDAYEDLIKTSSKLVEVSGLVGSPGLYNSKSSLIVERTISASYLIHQAFKMMESYQEKNGIEYVNVLRTRTEFGYYDLGGHYPKIDWDKDYSSAVYMPNWNFVSRGQMKPITSVGAISTFENMKVYCDLLNGLPVIARKFDKQPGKCWGDEYCYALHLAVHNIDWKALKDKR